MYLFGLQTRGVRGRHTSSPVPLLSKVVMRSYPRGVGYCAACWPGGYRENSPFFRHSSPGGGVPPLPPGVPEAAAEATAAGAAEAAAAAATAAATVPGNGGGGFILLSSTGALNKMGWAHD